MSANFISVTNFSWKCRRCCCFWVVHLPIAKQRIIPSVSFSVLPINCWTFCVKTAWLHDSMTLWCIKLCAVFFSGTPYRLSQRALVNCSTCRNCRHHSTCRNCSHRQWNGVDETWVSMSSGWLSSLAETTCRPIHHPPVSPRNRKMRLSTKSITYCSIDAS